MFHSWGWTSRQPTGQKEVLVFQYANISLLALLRLQLVLRLR
jgi:hypothetical protein